MSTESFPVDYAQRIAVVNALRLAFLRVKHHQKFTKRILPILREELPGYTVSVSDDGHFCRVGVWGNGLVYDKTSINLSWCTTKDDAEWVEKFQRELDINDCSDYAERQEEETKLLPQLEAIEAKIEALRAEAATMFETMPAPKSAKIRTSTSHWTRASYSLQKKFPLTFGGS